MMMMLVMMMMMMMMTFVVKMYSTIAVQPRPLWTKANSFQLSVAVTEGSELIPKRHTSANPKTPAIRKHSPLQSIFSLPYTFTDVLFSDGVLGPHPSPSITFTYTSVGPM